MAIQELPPKHCFDLRETDPSIVLIDVRDPKEFAAGHPQGALNVPVFFKEPGELLPNPDFASVVKRLAPTDRRVILSCAVGARSLRAAETLEHEGFQHLVNMVGGFSGLRQQDGTVVERGWADAGLPVSTEVGQRGWESLRTRG